MFGIQRAGSHHCGINADPMSLHQLICLSVRGVCVHMLMFRFVQYVFLVLPGCFLHIICKQAFVCFDWQYAMFDRCIAVCTLYFILLLVPDYIWTDKSNDFFFVTHVLSYTDCVICNVKDHNTVKGSFLFCTIIITRMLQITKQLAFPGHDCHHCQCRSGFKLLQCIVIHCCSKATAYI